MGHGIKRALWLATWFLFSSASLAQDGNHGPGDPVVPNAAPPAVVAPPLPRSEFCSPDFIHDPRFYEDPAIQPLLQAIEQAQQAAARALFTRANERQPDGKPAMGWMGLRTHLTGAQPNGTKHSDDREFASWALYLQLTGIGGLPTLRRYDRTFLDRIVREESAKRHDLPTSAEWLRQLPVNRQSGDPFNPIDWAGLLNDEAKVQQTYEKVFAGKAQLPPAQASLAVWREKAAGLVGNLPALELGKLSYFELTVLKEHLLNRFDAFSTEQMAWEDKEIDREGSPIRQHLAYFRAPAKLEGEERRRRRAAERREACVQDTVQVRTYSDFVSRYTGEIDAAQKLAPTQWHRHGLPLEFRAAVLAKIQASPLKTPLNEAARDLLGGNPADPNKSLLNATFRSQHGINGQEFFYLLYNSATQPPDLPLEFNREAVRPNPGNPNGGFFSRVVHAAVEADRKQKLDRLDAVGDLLRKYDTHSRQTKVQVLDRLFAQTGRKLTDDEKSHLLRLSPPDFDRVYTLAHDVVGADPRGFGPELRNLVQNYLPIRTPMTHPENAELLRGFDFTNPTGMSFNPAKLDKFRLFSTPPGATPAGNYWVVERNREILNHFASTLRDLETARAHYPTRGKLFAAFDDLYKESYQRTLSDLFCGKTPCDAPKVNEPFSEAEFLAAARAVNVLSLAVQHPTVQMTPVQPGLTGQSLDLAQRVSRSRYEHDLLEAELKRLNENLQHCQTNGQTCLAEEAAEAKNALFRQLYHDLERERRELEAMPHLFAGTDATANFNRRAYQTWRDTVEKTQTLLAKDNFGHFTVAPRVQSGVGFNDEDYRLGAIPANGPERYMSLEEGRVPHPTERYVTIHYPCDNGKSITMTDVPDSVLQSPITFRNYLKRRAMVESLKAAQMSGEVIDEVLTGKQENGGLKWTRERLVKTYAKFWNPHPDGVEGYLKTNPGACSTAYDYIMKLAGGMYVVRGDSRAYPDFRNYYDGIDAAIDRIFAINGGRNVGITYQKAPKDLQDKINELAGLPKDTAAAKVRELATGNADQRKLYSHLLSYTNRFPLDHPLREVVFAPSVPPHLVEAFKNDPCRQENPKTKLCLQELWEATSPDFQIREHAHFALGIHQQNEKPEDLEKRLKSAAQSARQQLAGTTVRDTEVPATPPPDPTLGRSPGKVLIERTNQRWVKRALDTADPVELNGFLAAPEIALDALENIKPEPPFQRMRALTDARAYYLLNLAGVRRLRAGGNPDIDNQFWNWIVGPGGKADPQKLARLDSILTAAVSSLNNVIHASSGALVDPTVLSMPPGDLVNAQLETLNHALSSAAQGNYNHQAYGSLGVVYGQRILGDKDGNTIHDSYLTTMDDRLYGTEACAVFLSQQEGKFGYHYQGILPGSRVLIARLPVGLRDMLEAMCLFRSNPPNEALDRAIAETILGAWPGKVMSTFLRPDAEALRRFAGQRMMNQIFARQVELERFIGERAANDQSRGLPPTPARHYPDYRRLAAVAGVSDPFSPVPAEEPWASQEKKWPAKGLTGFFLALPTMSPADKEAFRRWILNELKYSVSDSTLAELKSLSPTDLQKRLGEEFLRFNGSRFALHEKAGGFLNNSPDIDKHILLMLLALLNEGGTNLAGGDAAARDRALGGPTRFSPAAVALDQHLLEEVQPVVRVAQFDAAGAHAKYDGQFRDAKTYERYLQNAYQKANGQAMTARYELYREYSSYLAPDGLFDNCFKTPPSQLTKDQRADRRRSILSMMEHLRKVQPRDPTKFPGKQMGPEWRDMWGLAVAALHAVDHADEVETPIPPEIYVIPTPTPTPPGRWVTRERPVDPPDPAVPVRQIHLTKDSEDFANATGASRKGNWPMLCTLGDDHWKPILADGYKTKTEIIQQAQMLRRVYLNPGTDPRRAAEADVSPAFVQNTAAMVDTMEKIGEVNLLRFEGNLTDKMRDALRPLGYHWGREDVFRPLAEDADGLQDPAVKERVRGALREAHTAFAASAKDRANVQKLLPEWSMRVEGLFLLAEEILRAPNATKRAELQARYRRDLHDLQMLDHQRLSRGGLDSWVQELQFACVRLRERGQAYLRGEDPDHGLDYSKSAMRRRNRFLTMLDLASEPGQRHYSAWITHYSYDREGLKLAVDELKKARAEYEKDTEVRALVRGVSDDYESRILPLFDNLIRLGESQLAGNGDDRPGVSMLRRYSHPGYPITEIRAFEEVHPWRLPYLTRTRARELQAQYQADLTALKENKAVQADLDKLDPAIRAKLIAMQERGLEVLRHFLASDNPEKDEKVKESSFAAVRDWRALDEASSAKLSAVPNQTEAQKTMRAQIDAAIKAEQDAYAPHFVAEAPAPRPRLAPGELPATVPLAPSATVTPAPQPQQLQKILDHLAAANLSLGPGQRAQILQRDAETNQILLDLHPLMHDVLPKHGMQGLPQYWQRLALEGSPDDIRYARSVLLPALDEFNTRSEISPAQLRREIREEILQHGALTPIGQAKLARLARIDILQKWLPERLREVFSQADAEDARTIMRNMENQLASATMARAIALEKELRHDVGLEQSTQYVQRLTAAYRANGTPNPEAEARRQVGLLIDFAPHDPKHEAVDPAIRTLMQSHPEFVDRLRRIYNLSPLDFYAGGADTSAAEHPEQADLLRGRFLPEVRRAAEAHVAAGMSPAEAFYKAFDEIAQHDAYKGHAGVLAEVRGRTVINAKSNWSQGGAPGNNLAQHLNLEGQTPRAQWCEANTEKNWNAWEDRQKKRAESLEKSESAKKWLALRAESSWRTDALATQFSEVMARIRRHNDEVQILARKVGDIKAFKNGEDWKKLGDDDKRHYDVTLKAVEDDLQSRRGNLEADYKDLRDVNASMEALSKELTGKQATLMQELYAGVVDQHGHATQQQVFLLDAVSERRQVGDVAIGASPAMRQRAAWLERYFDWRERADSLGGALAETNPGDALPAGWERDPRVLRILDEVKDHSDGCAVAADKVLAIIRGGFAKHAQELKERAAQLAILARYHIHWNGEALDFEDFAIDANDGKNPAQRAQEIKDALNKLDKLLPQGSKDPAMAGLTRLLQGSPWLQFQDRLLKKWTMEGRGPIMEWFNTGKMGKPQPGVAITFKRNAATKEYDFEFQPLQPVRDEANNTAAQLRKRITDHMANIKKLREEKNRMLALFGSQREYHNALDANYAAIREDAARLRQFGAIAVEMKEGDRTIGPLPAQTVADHSELEYVNELRVDMEHTLQAIVRDQRWQLATYAATAAVVALSVASGVGVLTLPATVGGMLHGATLGFGLAIVGATVSQEIMPAVTGEPSQQTWSDIGPEAFKSAATFGLGEGAAAGLGRGAEAIWGARLLRAEGPTGVAGRGWNAFGKIASNQTAQKMAGMAGTHFTIHYGSDIAEAAMHDRLAQFAWGEKGLEHLYGSGQTAFYMWGPDQRAAGVFRNGVSRWATSVLVNQTLSLGMNAWRMRQQFNDLETQIKAAKAAGNEDRAKRLQAQLDEARKSENVFKQLWRANASELITHSYFGVQAAKAGNSAGVARTFARAADPANRGSMDQLRSRMTRQNEGPGLIRGTAQWVWGKITGRPGQEYQPSEKGDAQLGGIAAGQLPQHEINRLVIAAKADPGSDAAIAVKLLAEHYQMTPERFMTTWAEWVKSPHIQGTRPLGNFGAGQAARMGDASRGPDGKPIKPAEQDRYEQTRQFLQIAEQHLSLDILRTKHSGDHAKREEHIGELLALRPDMLETHIVQDNLPIDRLYAAAKGGGNGTVAQEKILAAMSRKLGMTHFSQMAAFFRGYVPRAGERLDWSTVKAAVTEASGANLTAQVTMIHEGRMTVEAIAGMFGRDVAEMSIVNYLTVIHPTWNQQRFCTQFGASNKTFKEFVATYTP